MATNAIDGLPTYAAVHVVSDLHLGGFDDGGRDYRIFRESDALSWLIGKGLPDTPVGRKCLVLNGDIVDFLAHRTPRYFDWARAADKLNDAIDDEQQRVVWKALQDFVASDVGDLVLVLGNHDLELALPEPQQVLMQYLTGGRQALRGRIHLALDGAGFSCRVEDAQGGKRVLCLHGNEADPWNAIDYGRLSLIRRALARGSMERNAAVLDNWLPNPGTQLVIDYLNAQKRKYQWIDLLKPEEEAVGMITAALCDLPSIRTFAETMAQQAQNKKRLADGFMAGMRDAGPGEARPAIPAGAAAPAVDTTAAIANAIEALARGSRPEDLVQGPDDAYLMSRLELVGRTLRLKVWPRSLREVLVSTLDDDRSFDISQVDDTFNELDDLVGPDAHFLVAGHTHLHRAAERRRHPGRYYFNSGTWIRLLSLPRDLLAADLFPQLEVRLRDGRLTELEQPIRTERGDYSLLRTTRTVVCIACDSDGVVRGELRTVEPAAPRNGAKPGTAAGWELAPVPGSCFPRRGAAS